MGINDMKVANMEQVEKSLAAINSYRLDHIRTASRTAVLSAEVLMDEVEQFIDDNFAASDPLWSLLKRAARRERHLLDIELRNPR